MNIFSAMNKARADLDRLGQQITLNHGSFRFFVFEDQIVMHDMEKCKEFQVDRASAIAMARFLLSLYEGETMP